MSESKELIELRRLIRSGFKVGRTLAKGGSNDSGFEITTTLDGSTANFRYLDSSATRDEEGNIKVSISDDGRSIEVALEKGATERVLISSEKDFWDFAIALYPSLDSNGNRILRRYRDKGRQINESKWLATTQADAEKRTEHLRRSFHASKGKVDSSLKALLLLFLRSSDWGGSRFLPLKEKFFELQDVLLRETQSLLATQKRVCGRNPEAQRYSDLVEELLNAFWQQEETFIKRSMRFVSIVRFDIGDAIARAVEQRKHVDDLMGMLAKRTPLPARKGVPHLLDAYRRYCQSLEPFIVVLSDLVCAVEKLPAISHNLGYKKRVALIKSTRFADIVRSLDPEIRHSESHDGTIIDDERALVVLTDKDERGERRTLGEYSYWQISDMTLDLQNGLCLAVLTAFALHETGLLLTALVSHEYRFALLSIDNLAD